MRQSAAEVGPVLNKTSPCQEIPPTTFWHCNPYLLCLKTLISISSSLVKTIALYAKQTCHKNVTKIMSFVTLSAVSMLIGIFHIGKFCFWVPFSKKLLLRNYVADFVEICNVCARKAIIEAAKRIINSNKVCHSYSDLNFGVTFLEHSVDYLSASWPWPLSSDLENLFSDAHLQSNICGKFRSKSSTEKLKIRVTQNRCWLLTACRTYCW